MRCTYFFILLATVLFLSCSQQHYAHPHVAIKTQYGIIEAEIYTDKAPKTGGAFMKYADEGLYNRSSFYRVLTQDNQPSDAVKAQLIQGGLWRTDYERAASLPGIPHESTKQTGILHKAGVLSMARLAPGTAGCEFFICVSDQPGFDYGGKNNADGQGYAAFGKVVKGMNIVRQIYSQPEYNQAFRPQVAIVSIKRM